MAVTSFASSRHIDQMDLHPWHRPGEIHAETFAAWVSRQEQARAEVSGESARALIRQPRALWLLPISLLHQVLLLCHQPYPHHHRYLLRKDLVCLVIVCD